VESANETSFYLILAKKNNIFGFASLEEKISFTEKRFTPYDTLAPNVLTNFKLASNRFVFFP